MTQATDPSRNDADGTVTTPAAGTSRAIEAIKGELAIWYWDWGRNWRYQICLEPDCHWAVGTFVLVSSFSWYTCRSALSKEQRVMKIIAERYPDRNAKKLKRKDNPNVPPEISGNQ
ncbi:hypothetical protein CTheo_688 [Ceratobasidium theobromae]|uniref:Cytochrome c oxidase assembly protein COX20, mitochondrial n=1 Tax=Ceratobasidium theobromae TaxID=1582974 RepID=A0A5N5QW55_9AGAM|nr:hypothetical protein CTheo_688 [Ceratobasidium theobromae]